MLYSRPVPHKEAHQQDPVTPTKSHHPSTLHLCPLSHLPSLGHHWPPSLPYKMGVPNPWACVSDFVQQACPTPAGAPARPSYIHHILPIKDTSPPSTFALSAPCLGLVTTGHLPCSTKWGGPTLVCTVGLSHASRHTSKTQSQHVTTTKFHHILPIKDTSPPSTFALSAPCLGLVTAGHLPYSTKWGGPTLGLVSLILYSRPVSHHQTHQQDPVTTTKFHHDTLHH